MRDGSLGNPTPSKTENGKGTSMKIDLSQLDLEGMTLDLGPNAEPRERQLIEIAYAKEVRGTAEQTKTGLTLESATVSELLVRSMRLRLGSVLLEFHEALLTGVNCQLTTGAPGLRLNVKAHTLVSPRIRIELSDTVILGEGHFEGVSLVSQPGQGRIDAEAASVRGLAVDLGKLTLRSHQLQTTELCVKWGEAFHLAMHRPRLNTLTLAVANTQLEGTHVGASAFALTDGDIRVDNLQLAELKLAQDFGAPTRQAAPDPSHETTVPADHEAASGDEDEEETVTPARPDIARIVDGLSGHLHADVTVEVALPVLISRGAVHKLRLDVQEGTINFRRLEHGLSLLEDALLDFSVRSKALVLEIGLPLLPTRGFGKPILRWPLTDHELDLARQNRIHLSTLLSPMGVRQKRNGSSEGSDNRLRHVAVQNLDCDLTLRHDDPSSVVRRAELHRLRLAGQIRYRPDGSSKETSIRGSTQRLALDIQGWQLSEHCLEAADCEIASVPELELALTNGKPVRLALTLSEPAIARLRWTTLR